MFIVYCAKLMTCTLVLNNVRRAHFSPYRSLPTGERRIGYSPPHMPQRREEGAERETMVCCRCYSLTYLYATSMCQRASATLILLLSLSLSLLVLHNIFRVRRALGCRIFFTVLSRGGCAKNYRRSVQFLHTK
jgi:hypothetical protein